MPNQQEKNKRVPPNNIDAEQAILGSILLDSRCADEAVVRLMPDDFYNPRHKDIFATIIKLVERGKPIDIVSVADMMEMDNTQYIGMYEDLSRLADAVPSVRNLSYYIQIVSEKSSLRKLLGVSTNIADACFSGNDEAKDILSSAGDAIYNLAVKGTDENIIHIKEAMKDSMKHINDAMRSKDGLLGVPTGFPLMDKMLSGLQGSQLVVVAGRPGMGKTSFALNIIEHVALVKKKPCFVFSLEMSADQLATRLMCSQARLDSSRVRMGNINRKEVELLARAITDYRESPIYINDSASINVTQIRAQAQRLKRRYGLDLIAIDYLQLMQGTSKTENRVQEVTQMTRSLKIMAKDLNVPIILLSQLSRASEKRDKKSRYPLLSDLRESGSIEQDADVVIFLQREDYYPEDNTPENAGKARIIIAKQRNGPTGSIQVVWHGKFTKYEELDLIHDEEDAYF